MCYFGWIPNVSYWTYFGFVQDLILKKVEILSASKLHFHSRLPKKILKVLHIYKKNVLGKQLSQVICSKCVFRLLRAPKLQMFSIKLNIMVNVVRYISKSEACLQVFYEKSVLMNFTNFTGKHLCRCLYFNKVSRLQPKERLLYRPFSVSFAKYFRIIFWQNFSG